MRERLTQPYCLDSHLEKEVQNDSSFCPIFRSCGPAAPQAKLVEHSFMWEIALEVRGYKMIENSTLISAQNNSKLSTATNRWQFSKCGIVKVTLGRALKYGNFQASLLKDCIWKVGWRKWRIDPKLLLTLGSAGQIMGETFHSSFLST